MSGTRGAKRGTRTLLGVLIVMAVVAVAGCQTPRGGDRADGPGAPDDPDSHPCERGAPGLETLGGDTFGPAGPTDEDIAWQNDAGTLAEEVTAIAGDRLAAVWLAWEPERSLQVRLTEGPEIPELQDAADASGLVVDIAYVRAFSEAELRAAADGLGDAWAHVPGVGGMGVDTLGGRLVFDVASGDDGGAATCAALAEVLADVGVPYGFAVFEGPTESTVRGPVPFAEVYLITESTLRLNVSSCGGDPEVTVLEETDSEVRLEITSTNAAPGWMSAACLDGLEVGLAAPLGDRTLIDISTGRPVDVAIWGDGGALPKQDGE